MTLRLSGSLPRALLLALLLAPTTLRAQITDRARLVAALDSAAQGAPAVPGDRRHHEGGPGQSGRLR